MQRKEFENRIKSLLPKAADDVVESWAEYATELDQDGTEAAADFYDKNYIALLLVKQRRGEEIATQLFNFGNEIKDKRYTQAELDAMSNEKYNSEVFTFSVVYRHMELGKPLTGVFTHNVEEIERKRREAFEKEMEKA